MKMEKKTIVTYESTRNPKITLNEMKIEIS